MGSPVMDALRAKAAAYPGAEKAFLFGDHEVYRVKEKVFVWLGDDEDGGTYVSLKLKVSQGAALALPFTSPAAYGMGKWGWTDARFPKGAKPPLPLLLQWLDESYRHTAPKTLLKLLDGAGAAPAKPKPTVKARAAASPARGKPRATKRRP